MYLYNMLVTHLFEGSLMRTSGKAAICLLLQRISSLGQNESTEIVLKKIFPSHLLLVEKPVQTLLDLFKY